MVLLLDLVEAVAVMLLDPKEATKGRGARAHRERDVFTGRSDWCGGEDERGGCALEAKAGGHQR